MLSLITNNGKRLCRVLEVARRWYLRDRLLKYECHFKGVCNGENGI